jgi:hypothetical protein
MKKVILFLSVCFCSLLLKAQTKEDSVKAVINKMFESMKNADTSSLRSVFADSAILQTITKNAESKIIVRHESIEEFIEIIGKEVKGNADEQIVFETVKTDGPLAMAWTPYKFYYKGRFSHCGVNSFQLVKQNGEWKIQYIIDTRRRMGCE